MRQVILAKTAGFCFGVNRAVELVEQAARSERRAVTLGPIIHNHHVVRHFADLGVRQVDAISEIEDGETVIIRSHGVPRAAFEALAARGLSVIDATCPFVSRIHKLVAEAEQEGRQPVIIGQKNHPEVLAIAGWCAHPLVFETAEELENWLGGAPERPYLPISMVFQTTSTKDSYEKCS